MVEKMATVDRLYRYTVKGLSPEPLEEIDLVAGEGVPFDRLYALALADTVFDMEFPTAQPKTRFLMLLRDESLATVKTRFDPQTETFTVVRDGTVVLSEKLKTPEGRLAVERFFEDLVQPASGRPRLVSLPPARFTDVSVVSPALMNSISIINLASVRDLADRVGAPINPLRYRANIYLDGLAPWTEFEWIDREIAIGPVRLKPNRKTKRCGATEVNPDTGQRDLPVPALLKKHLGHIDCGIYAEVLSDGRIVPGSSVLA
jgi:uncharacterized protein